jgi:uncharacterized membrane protein YgdD (TMEM256/DUF423 family)
MVRWLMIVVAIFGASGVAIGAAGAHALPDLLGGRGLDAAEVSKEIERVETGVRYQLFHTVALLCLSLSPATQNSRLLKLSAAAMSVGILLFSGGLFYHVFFNNAAVMKIVPYGGTLMIASWVGLGLSAIFYSGKQNN